MKIINNPNPQNPPRRVICEKCQCEFEFDKSDERYWSNGILGPGYSSRSWVVCPNCGNEITTTDSTH